MTLRPPTMTMQVQQVLGAAAIAAALAGCGRPAHEPVAPTAPAASRPAAGPARWIGRWQGPEGTFLDISGSAGAYRVTVQNLDGPRSFDAIASEDAISFTRDGVKETIRAGSGADTGMKWLADKKDCLVVKAGEGYCRG